MAQLMETIERTGSGFTIYYYPAGNPHAKQEVREVAESQTKSNIILMPRLEGDPTANAYGLERIEPSATSINSLQQIVHDFFELQIKRFILGQTLSSEPHATGLGSGVADLHQDTFAQIVQYDAIKLEETLTQEFLRPLQQFNFPRSSDVELQLKLNYPSPQSPQRLATLKTAWDMGAKIRTQDVLEAAGVSAPQSGEEVLCQRPVVSPKGSRTGDDGDHATKSQRSSDSEGAADLLQSAKAPLRYYRPDQARAPAGSHEGGQFVSEKSIVTPVLDAPLKDSRKPEGKKDTRTPEQIAHDEFMKKVEELRQAERRGDFATGDRMRKELGLKPRGFFEEQQRRAKGTKTDRNWLQQWYSYLWAGKGDATDEELEAALEAAGKSYRENAGLAHQALQKLGTLGPLVSSMLSFLEGNDLHDAIMRDANNPNVEDSFARRFLRAVRDHAGDVMDAVEAAEWIHKLLRDPRMWDRIRERIVQEAGKKIQELAKEELYKHLDQLEQDNIDKADRLRDEADALEKSGQAKPGLIAGKKLEVLNAELENAAIHFAKNASIEGVEGQRQFVNAVVDNFDGRLKVAEELRDRLANDPKADPKELLAAVEQVGKIRQQRDAAKAVQKNLDAFQIAVLATVLIHDAIKDRTNRDEKFEEYLKDIETQTKQKLNDTQRKAIKEDWESGGRDARYLGPNKTKERRDEFGKQRDRLIAEWERNTGGTWSSEEKIERDSEGKIVKRTTRRFDAHEIRPNSYGSPHEWWNIIPARNPDQHQSGIHRKDGPGRQLFPYHNWDE